ncbi:NAD(P)/FAD-dependent oxidoreductase [Oceaniglobus indicus]|uniref:NAD(P)/FAD-dependent oxidoreductase n=1 Tax=Oceaniglobus indicus TaxID=2047749 RepID=UPI000C196517|nr:FAD-dependent oxidoreductase [Oceaniglobus indicus]
MTEGSTAQATGRRHVAIIGAGIVGVSCAIWLLRDGHRVTLIDRAGPGEGTSFGNGGVLASCAIVPVQGPGLIGRAPGMVLNRDQPLFVRWRHLPRAAPWLAKYLAHANAPDARRIAAALAPIVGDSLADHLALAAGSDAERWIVPTDYLYLYRDRAAFLGDSFGWDLRAAHGFEWREIEAGALDAFDPVFSDDLSFAVQLGNHGRIRDPAGYVRDLAAYAGTLGARTLRGEVDAIRCEGGAVRGVRTGSATVDCDAVVLATGVWSAKLAGSLGLAVPLESERGYHIDLWGASPVPKVPAMIAGGKFVMTPMDGRLRLAGVVEFGGLDAGPSRAPFDLLLRQARAAIPGLTWEDKTEWMGHRPAITDSIPVIGEIPGVRGAFVGFGHHHVGLTGGPKTGRVLARMIGGRKAEIDLAPYSPARFMGSRRARTGRHHEQGDRK